ncbi:MAG: hypothetical protein ACJAZ8_002658 [Planctomycetota bacterium]|jgi:hypothetical protein
MDSAAKDAAYELTSIGLHASGTVVRQHCDTCDGPALFFELPTTKQQFELGFDAPLGPIQIDGLMFDWDSGHGQLEVWVDQATSTP